MTDKSSSGGMAGWSGAAFELRLGVEFCVYILIGEDAGFGCGAATRVQLQAPQPVDDLVLEFDTGTRRAVQANVAPSTTPPIVIVNWPPWRPPARGGPNSSTRPSNTSRRPSTFAGTWASRPTLPCRWARPTSAAGPWPRQQRWKSSSTSCARHCIASQKR